MLFDTYYIARVKYILYWLCTSWLTCTVLYCTGLFIPNGRPSRSGFRPGIFTRNCCTTIIEFIVGIIVHARDSKPIRKIRSAHAPCVWTSRLQKLLELCKHAQLPRQLSTVPKTAQRFDPRKETVRVLQFGCAGYNGGKLLICLLHIVWYLLLHGCGGCGVEALRRRGAAASVRHDASDR